MSTYSSAVQFFKNNQINDQNFDYFDYADFIENLDDEKLSANPHRKKIVEQFMLKCEQKLAQKEKNKGKWKQFLSRMQKYQKYQAQKREALDFLYQHYDYKNQQVLFYPKLSKSMATQKGRCWKDVDDLIAQQQPIHKPNYSTFDS